MCGIAGKICGNDRVDRQLIDAMCQVIVHRGPDSHGVFLDSNVGLGVRRLAVIDLDSGDQPIFNEDQSVVVVLNGEIYNFRELRDQLVDRGHRFSTKSDTEAIVHLYEEHGEHCVHYLRGMFAFALWDRTRERLLLARDRIGKKPLYYRVAGKSLWFGSEAKAILVDPMVSRDVDHAAIDTFLQYQHVPGRHCAFAALSKLPPAHVLVWERGKIDLQRYWKLDYEDRPAAPDEELAEEVRSELLEATRLRLRSDVPVGAFLSGGVDSSAVVAAMAQVSETPIKTFTIGFPERRYDERPFAREVANIFGTDHHEFVVAPNIIEILPRLAWHYSEPFADQSAVPSFYLSELTRQHVTVALNGDGGDENFGGYKRYAANELARRLSAVPSAVHRPIAAALERLGTGPAQDTTRARLLRLARSLGQDPASRYATWVACFTEQERDVLYTPDMRAAVQTQEARAVVRDPYEASNASTLIERLLDVDTQTYLPDQLLVKMDVASMANSLEVRSPLLDHHFMERIAALPLGAKMTRSSAKRLLKEAVRPWLPNALLERPKQGFTMPIADWLRRELRAFPQTMLLSERSRQRGLFEPAAIEQLLSDHHRGLRDNSTKLWALLQLELWFQTYVDATPARPITLDLIDRQPQVAAA
jgi:asparagine synthase (glutamine-hydrolysing)